MSVKEIALETLSQLPDNADWQAVLERLNFVAGVEEGLEQLDAGNGIPVEDIERELREWTTK